MKYGMSIKLFQQEVLAPQILMGEYRESYCDKIQVDQCLDQCSDKLNVNSKGLDVK